MMLDEWHNRLVNAERKLGLKDGFRFVYGPEETLKSPRVAFLSLNPGKAPSDTTARQVTDERGNSYEVEKFTTLSPLTEQALRAFSFFGLKPLEVMTGVICPFRTPGWSDLSTSQRHHALDLGREFWTDYLTRPSLELIICCSNEVTTALTRWTNATLENETSAAWGNIKISRYQTKLGTPILALPHLSRFRLFGRPASETAIRNIMGH